MSADVSPPTIFVVEDDAAVARAIARLLRADGWQVKTFGSAEAFLAARDPSASGCLVLDVNLPGLDGLALQQRLHDAGEALPIVFLTEGTVDRTVDGGGGVRLLCDHIDRTLAEWPGDGCAISRRTYRRHCAGCASG